MESKNTAILTAILTFITPLFSVLYSESSYDVWDLLIGIFVIIVYCKYMRKNTEDKLLKLIGIISVSISITIIIMILTLFIQYGFSNIPIKHNEYYRIFDQEFILTAFISVCVYFLERLVKNN